MILGIISAIIGVMVLAFGIYYLIKEKSDPESKKIYTTASIGGALVLIFGVLKIVGVL